MSEAAAVSPNATNVDLNQTSLEQASPSNATACTSKEIEQLEQELKKKMPNSFWKTTNSDFSADSLAEKHGLLNMQQLIRRTDDLKKPVRPKVDDEDFIYMNTVKLEGQEIAAERVLSAHVLPKKFPVDPDRLIYPPVRETNPLYYTTSTVYGNEKPRPHQVAEAFFPKSNKFSKSYTDSKPRYCGLNTSTDKRKFIDY